MSPNPHTASAASRSKLPANTDRRPSSTCSAPVQQRIGPVDRRPQRLLALQRGAAAPGQQPEPLVQAVVQAAPATSSAAGPRPARWPAASRPAAGRSTPPAGRSARPRPGRRPAPGPGPRTARPHRRTQPPRSRIAGSGQRQRRHPVDGLAADAQRLPAGGQQVHPRAAPHDRVRGLGAAADQVLAVIQHDQHILRGQGIQQGLQGGPARLGRRAPAPRRWPPATASSLGDRGQLHQPDPVPGPIQQLGGHLQAQPGLAAPAGPVKVTRRAGFHQGPDLCHLPVPADERRQLGGQIVRQRRVAQRPQRRELRVQGRRAAAGRSVPGAPGPSAGARPDRPAPRPAAASPAPAPPPTPTPAPAPHADRGHPGGPVHLQAHQAGGRLRRLAAMDSHPHPDPLPARPRMSWRACCISSTAATHARGEENTAKNASPCVSTSLPSCAASADRISA